jgi:ankyrin repeat protein
MLDLSVFSQSKRLFTTTGLFDAVRKGDTRALRKRLRSAPRDAATWMSPEREDRARTLLHVAAAGGHTECVSLLVNEVDPTLVHWRDLDHSTPCALAIAEGHTDCLRALLKQ